ncbi:MAG: hypothetical protein HN802_03505 [Candidatus Jacksonbacteria bacterium]|nr:hypothetical protein [Candidatus Jacksonbacteria bacterium]
MAFIDTSNTIALDATLTELGRKRMAEGRFKVTKFTFGDDEVDYSMSTSSAGTYEVMNTQGFGLPVFEATTAQNSVINYSLTHFTRNDLLYLPVLKTNEQLGDSAMQSSTGSVYYLAANTETVDKLKLAFIQPKADNYILSPGNQIGARIIIESGLETLDMIGAGTPSMRKSFILNTELLDNYYYLNADHRFFTRFYGPTSLSVFRNGADSAVSRVNFGTLEDIEPVSLGEPLENYKTFIFHGVDNLVFNKTEGSGGDTKVSSITGPRGSATAVSMDIDDSLKSPSTATRDIKYGIYGSIDQTLFGGSDKYDYIDSTIYVEGCASSRIIQLPIRIIRFAGT